DGQRLAVNVGRNTAHHVMAGRYNRYRLDDRIGVREGFRQLADTGQARVQHFLAEVLKLEVDVVAVGTAAAAFDDFANHRTRDNVATGKVLGVRRVAFHETLAILINEVTAFTAAAFGDEYTSTGDTCRVELPHFNILYRHAGAQTHADTVAGVDVRVGRRCVDTAGTAGRKYGRFRFHINRFTGFDADGDDTSDDAVLIFDDVDRVPLVEEYGFVLQVGLIPRVQQRVAGAVSSGAGTRSLAALAEVFRLAAERTLVNTAFLGTGERQTHVVEFKNSLRTNGAHVLDRVLVADVVGTLD